MRTTATLFLLLFLAAAAIASPDSLKAHRNQTKRIEKEESRFWREFQGRFTEAFKAFRAPIDQAAAKASQYPEATYDYSGLRDLYNDYAALQRRLGEADRALAGSGDPGAAARLLDMLLAVGKRIAKLDQELLEARPIGRRYVFDQRAPVERHGLAVRRAALIDALGACNDAAPLLMEEGWKRARRADRKRGIVHRVAILDAVARCGEPGRPLLADQLDSNLSSLRVVAIEGLMGPRIPDLPQLESQLGARAPVVRRALLQEISRKGDASWIEPLVERLAGLKGVEATLCVDALETLTHQRFGHAPARWVEWFEDYRKEIESGKFDREKVEVREVERIPGPAPVRFYGVETTSHALAFVIEGSSRIACPADWDRQKERIRWSWKGTRRQWEKEYPSHRMILARELEPTLAQLGSEGMFALVILQGQFDQDFLEERKLVAAKPSMVKAALRMVGKMPATGWCSQLAGLMAAAGVGGMGAARDADCSKAELDTIYLLDSGDPAGGRFFTPESALAAFKRFNRYRRLIVHALRICNEKDASELLMKGIAESSGGTYRWLRKPG